MNNHVMYKKICDHFFTIAFLLYIVQVYYLQWFKQSDHNHSSNEDFKSMLDKLLAPNMLH